MEERKEGRLTIDHTVYSTKISRRFEGRKPYSPLDPGKIMSFIPGTITEVLVAEGDEVQAGDDIVILDAMKMKNRLKSHVSGKVLSVNVKTGDRVTRGTVLVEIA